MNQALIKFIILTILWLAGSPQQLLAQNLIKGKVTDENASPIANAAVSINGTSPTNTENDGSFTVNHPSEKIPELVKASKQGYMLKDWSFNAGKLNIIMAKPQSIKGRVLSNRTVPIANINVLLFGVRGLEAVKTDLDGYFTLSIPSSMSINENSKFIVYDPNRLQGKANYEIKIQNQVVYLFVDIPPLPVTLVKIKTEDKQTLPNTKLSINDQTYTSNQEGEISPKNADNFSRFKVQNYYIKNLKYDEIANTMEITVRNLASAETEEQKAISTIDDKKVNLSIAYTSLTEENQSIASNIASLEARLTSGENISADERSKIQAQLQKLRILLSENEKALGYVREQAKDAVVQLEALLSDQIDLNKETQKELKESEKDKKIAQERAEIFDKLSKRNWIIFSIIVLALLIIAGLFYISNRQINNKKNELAEKVGEINQKNEMLEESAAIMDVKNKQIKEKNEQLILKTEELEEKNKHITDSIRYAETIQQSILPDTLQMKQLLPEIMTYYKPKDIVSGDFYWFSAKQNTILIAAADCTGHGVPGAFMTMMGSSILNQIVKESSITDPSQILELLNTNVQANLKKQTLQGLRDGDGMDISLAKIDLTQQNITFAGAKNPLYIVQENELKYYKGSNISIGSTLKSKNKKFENRVIQLQGGETVYLVSDGFQDQLGGNHKPDMPRKKYMKTKFIQLLSDIHPRPFEEQQAILDRELENWRGENNSQTDDIVIIGFRIPADLLKANSPNSLQSFSTRSW